MSIHAHVTAWFLTLVLFFIAYYLQKKGRAKPVKIIQMILRLLYLIVLGTGLYFTFIWFPNFSAILKSLIGIWVLFTMEYILVRGGKGQKTTVFWYQFIAALVLVFYLGYFVLG